MRLYLLILCVCVCVCVCVCAHVFLCLYMASGVCKVSTIGEAEMFTEAIFFTSGKIISMK